MMDKDILRKAMEKACANSSRIMKNIMPHGNDFDILLDFYKNIIFDHDFAKAFWGEELIVIDEHYKGEIVPKNDKFAPYCLHGDYIQSWKLEFPKWKMHLREMILEKEPLKYLEKFL